MLYLIFLLFSLQTALCDLSKAMDWKIYLFMLLGMTYNLEHVVVRSKTIKIKRKKLQTWNLPIWTQNSMFPMPLMTQVISSQLLNFNTSLRKGVSVSGGMWAAHFFAKESRVSVVGLNFRPMNMSGSTICSLAMGAFFFMIPFSTPWIF